MLHSFWQDVRYALRMLLNKPGFTVVAVLTLALGIGANTAIFSVIDALLLRPLDYKNADQILFLNSQSAQKGIFVGGVSLPEFLDWRQQSKTIQGMSAFNFFAFTFTQSGGALRVIGLEVSPNLFDVLGETPEMGRFFAEGEDRPGNDNVLVITDSFWRAQLAADPNVIGKQLRVDSRPFTVVGVLRSSFSFLGPSNQMFKPLPLTNAALADRTQRPLSVVARLKDGSTVAQAAAEMAVIGKEIEKEHPDTNTGWTITVAKLQDVLSGNLNNPLYVLLAAVLFVLLIACLNIAGLMTARMTARAKEVSLRMAMGASRARLLRQFLTEGILLSFLGGAGGVLLSFPALKVLLATLPAGFVGNVDVALDTRILVFTIFLSFATGIFFGIVPAWNLNRVQVSSVLKEAGSATTGGKSRLGLQSALVVSQVVLSLVLLTTAGLLIRSFLALRGTDPGFKAQGVLINTQLVLPTDKYTTTEQSVAFFKQLIERIQTFPGVVAAGGITSLPLQGNSGTRNYEIIGHPVSTDGGQRGAVVNVVTENYFNTMGIPLIRGRELRDSDNAAAPRVALINDALARREFPGLDPIGQRILLGARNAQPYEIVGIVGSAKQFSLGQDALPEIFTPYQQSPVSFMYVVVKAHGDPNQLAAPIRAAVRDLDPDQPVGHRTLEQQFDNAISGQRFYAVLLGVFAGLALVLAGVGIYGVLSYLVGQRTREIGIRMALGASRASVLRHVLARGFRLAGTGLLIGFAASLGIARLLGSLLYRVGAADPISFIVAVIVLGSVAVIACWVPALRATKVDPIVALHYE
ncbi:MAG TPA: ABC transporter permease [Candidatus Acidoferrum sp.]|nr:ABC transporter permease [Candidatus Acidoferrum sp.]